MSTLSQFFPVATGGGAAGPVDPKYTSTLRMFLSTGSIAIPNNVCYMAYGVIGAGGNGPGGGFSYKDGAVTCASEFTVCAIVGAALQGRSENNQLAGSSCITGICTGVICATGGGGGACSSSTTWQTVGVGSGGDINTCGAIGGNCNNETTSGGGAGGLYGNGGQGGTGTCGSTGQWGGGGYGSGGGGGAGAMCGTDTNNHVYNGFGGAGAQPAPFRNGWDRSGIGQGGGNGHAGRGAQGSSWALSGQARDAEVGYIPGYTKSGLYSQAKTFLGAAGGGGALAGACCATARSRILVAGRAAPGGGGSYHSPPGFGGGYGNIHQSCGGAIGGGGSFTNQGFAILEYWTS